MASYYGALEVVGLLLEQGADVRAVDDGGQTALQIAEKSGEFEVKKLLLEHDAK